MVHQITPRQYSSMYFSSRPLLVAELEEEARERYLESIMSSKPYKMRETLPVVSDNYYISHSYSKEPLPIEHSDLMLLDSKEPFCIGLHNTTPTIVNDKNCYYTKYTYCCPKCGKEISFVDVTSIRFLAEEDNSENGNFSFLELSEMPLEVCPTPKCKAHFVNTFFNPDLLKRTVSYRLVQILRLALSQNAGDDEKRRDFDYLMPKGTECSLEFVGSKIMLGLHGYSYLVHTYKCCHCQREYTICDLSSLRKEPFFIPKDLRSISIEAITNSKASLAWHKISSLLKSQDKEQSFLPSEQWALPPYCLECGHCLYSYDLYKGDPIPSRLNIFDHNSLFI